MLAVLGLSPVEETAEDPVDEPTEPAEILEKADALGDELLDFLSGAGICGSVEKEGKTGNA